MSIDRETVKYIAQLARIDLDEREIECYSSQLKKILNYIEKINELDLDDITASSSIHKDVNVYRKDQAVKFENINGLLKIVPCLEGSLIKIPKVIE